MIVCIEIKDRMLNLVENILIQKYNMKKELQRVVEKMKSLEEPVFIDLDKVNDIEVVTQITSCLCVFAISQEAENSIQDSDGK